MDLIRWYGYNILDDNHDMDIMDIAMITYIWHEFTWHGYSGFNYITMTMIKTKKLWI